jgi:hypothetical protein
MAGAGDGCDRGWRSSIAGWLLLTMTEKSKQREIHLGGFDKEDIWSSKVWSIFVKLEPEYWNW